MGSVGAPPEGVCVSPGSTLGDPNWYREWVHKVGRPRQNCCDGAPAIRFWERCPSYARQVDPRGGREAVPLPRRARLAGRAAHGRVRRLREARPARPQGRGVALHGRPEVRLRSLRRPRPAERRRPSSRPTTWPPKGVVFTDLRTAVAEHPELLKEHFFTDVADRRAQVHGAARRVPLGWGARLRAQGRRGRAARSRSCAGSRPGARCSRTRRSSSTSRRALTFVDRFRSEDCPTPVASASSVVEVEARRGATVNYISLQEWGRNVHHFQTQRFTGHRDSTVRSLAVNLGSTFARTQVESVLKGEGSFSEMLGLYFADSRPALRPAHASVAQRRRTRPRTSSTRGAQRAVALRVLGSDQGAQGRAGNRRLPGEPQPRPVRGRDGALDPAARDRGERGSLHARRDRVAGRGGAPLLSDEPRHRPRDRAEARRVRLLRRRARPHPRCRASATSSPHAISAKVEGGQRLEVAV